MNNCRTCRFEPLWEQFDKHDTLMVGHCQMPTLMLPNGLRPLLLMRGGIISFQGMVVEACPHHLEPRSC
jgi:hypothetical protein